MSQAINNFLGTTGFAKLFSEPNWWQYIAMYVIIGALFYLAIVKKFEPLLLMPIAFGMLLANLPGAELIHLEYFFDEYYLSTEGTELTGTLWEKIDTTASCNHGFASHVAVTYCRDILGLKEIDYKNRTVFLDMILLRVI